MTGTAWIDDYGVLFYPIAITNTNSVGTVRDALIEWGAERLPDALHCCLPVVAETRDGDLNDIFGFGEPAAPGHARRLHGGGPGAVQLRAQATAPDRRHSGGSGAQGARAVLRHQ
jgi:L-aminopeptidase/D-esterase-like protein